MPPTFFEFLALSSRKEDQTRALAAFKIIDEDGRTYHDYERAVRAAVKADSYGLAVGINNRATQHDLQQTSSVFLLLHAVTNQLWSTANTVWTASFREVSLRFDQQSSTHAALVSEVGNYRDLPVAIYQLGVTLRGRAPVTMRNAGSLRRLFNRLLAALVSNGQLMSIITPNGLQKSIRRFLRTLSF